MNNIVASYLYDQFDVDLAIAGVLASCYGLMNIFARSVGGLASDWASKRFGMRGRLWCLWLWQTIEGVMCIFMALAKDDLATTIAMMVLFSICVQASEGASYGIVPYITRRALGVASGFIGAGGNRRSPPSASPCSSPAIPSKPTTVSCTWASPSSALLCWSFRSTSRCGAPCSSVRTTPPRKTTTSKTTSLRRNQARFGRAVQSSATTRTWNARPPRELARTTKTTTKYYSLSSSSSRRRGEYILHAMNKKILGSEDRCGKLEATLYLSHKKKKNAT